MKPEEALKVLVNAVQFAQQKGAYTLADAKVIAEAVETFTKKEEVKEEPKVEETPEVKE